MHEIYIKDVFNHCNVGRLVGIDIYEVGLGFAKGRLKIQSEHINVFGSVHGGILFTFADHVGGACGNTLGGKAVLVESSIQYMKGALEGEVVFAEATVTYTGRKLGRIDVKVHKENGDLMAIVHQIFFIKNDDRETKTTQNI